MRNEWWCKTTREPQAVADDSDVKSYYGAFKTAHGPMCSPSTLLYSKDGTVILRSLEDIKKRWTEHFEDFLSTSNEVNFDVIYNLEQKHIHWSINQTPI